MSLSVVIPCRDGEAYLAETLRSLSLQTRQPDEVILVDDGSVDRSVEIAQGFGPPIRVVTGEARGPSAARTLGASLASGDRLMFLDADDLLSPDALASLDAALDDHPDQFAMCPWKRWERERPGSGTLVRLRAGRAGRTTTTSPRGCAAGITHPQPFSGRARHSNGAAAGMPTYG